MQSVPTVADHINDSALLCSPSRSPSTHTFIAAAHTFLTLASLREPLPLLPGLDSCFCSFLRGLLWLLGQLGSCWGWG